MVTSGLEDTIISTKDISRLLPRAFRDNKTDATEKANKQHTIFRIKKGWATLALKSAAVVAVSVLLLSSYRTPTSDAFFTFSDIGGEQADVLATFDDLAEAELVAMLAELADIPAIQNQASGIEEELGYDPETLLVTKNQVVKTDALTNEDIVTHSVAEGDTLASIAQEYRVSEDTVKWANNLRSSSLAVGKELQIPPVTGVIHKVTSTDTAASLASKYDAVKEEIIFFNDAEIDGLAVGETIVIPNGTKPQPQPVRRSYASSTPTSSVTRASYSSLFNSEVVSMAHPGSSPYATRYTYGFCTWWAAHRASVLGNGIDFRNTLWSHARNWDSAAAREGRLHTTPVVGAVAQTDRMHYLGHVAVVEAVSADGTQIKISDMNALIGWNRPGKTVDWIPTSLFKYIY